MTPWGSRILGYIAMVKSSKVSCVLRVGAHNIIKRTCGSSMITKKLWLGSKVFFCLC